MAKKWISLLMCTVLMLLCAVPALAAEEPSMTITVNDSTKAVQISVPTTAYDGSIANFVVWLPGFGTAIEGADLNAETAFIGQAAVSGGKAEAAFTLRDNAPSGSYTAAVMIQGDAMPKTQSFNFQDVNKAAYVLGVAQTGDSAAIMAAFAGDANGSLNDVSVEGYKVYMGYSDSDNARRQYVADYIAANRPTDLADLKTKVLAAEDRIAKVASLLAADRTNRKAMIETDHALFQFTDYATYQAKASDTDFIEKFYTELGTLLAGCVFPEDVSLALAGAMTAAGLQPPSVTPSTPQGTQTTGGISSGSLKLDKDVIPEISGETNQAEYPFADFGEAEWAAVPITVLYDRGVVKGKTETAFCPNDVITREEALQMLVKAFKIKAVSITDLPFSDVTRSNWFYESVRIAEQRGIVKGISGTEFGTGLPVSRQDLAVMIMNTLSVMGKSLGETETAPKAFSDAEQIASYAQKAVSNLQAAGILNGRDNNCYVPEGTATRAEVAKIIYSVLYMFNML